MDTTARGQVIALVLDGVDPRLPADDRYDAVERAGELDVHLAFPVAVGMLAQLIAGYQRKFGDEAAASIMRQLAAISVGLVDVDCD